MQPDRRRLLSHAHLPEDATGTATIDANTNLLRGVRSGAITATASVLHAGGTTIVVKTEIRDGDARLVAKTTQVEAVLRW